MKIRLQYTLLLTLVIACGVADKAAAQDAGMSDVDILKERDRIENEKLVFSPGEAEVRYDPQGATHVLKDSVAVHAVELSGLRAAKPGEKQRKQDDSVLSFNFLYYIIQKYKLQDIVD